MNRILRILCGAACAFAFCFLAIGYAAVQDELLVTGSVSVKAQNKPFAVYGPIYDANGQFVENALNFYYRPIVQVGGEIPLGEGKQKVTEVYTDIATLALSAAEDQPWSAHQTDIKSIDVIDEGIQPINMAHWFSGFGICTSFNLKNLDTSKVTNMVYMFYGCSAVQTLDWTGFDTSKVVQMGHMFENCTSLRHLDLSSFNTSRIMDSGMDEECMNRMFYNCSNLETLDISSFKTQNINSISDMFSKCGKLKTIYAGSDFDGESLAIWWGGRDPAFDECTSLIGGSETGFDSSKNTAEYARIDGKGGQQGYFTGIVHIDLHNNFVPNQGMDADQKTESSLYGITWDFNGTGNFKVDEESSIKLKVYNSASYPGVTLPAQVVLTSQKENAETIRETVTVDNNGVVTIPAKLMREKSKLEITRAQDTNSLNDETSENIVETIPLITHIENITWMPSGKLAANNDFGILMTANEGCIFPDTIMVEIEGVGYHVAANGEHTEGEPWFDPEENILYIPGTLLTETTKSVTVMAVAVQAPETPAPQLCTKTEGCTLETDHEGECLPDTEAGSATETTGSAETTAPAEVTEPAETTVPTDGDGKEPPLEAGTQ